jgi:hypothetical protein
MPDFISLSCPSCGNKLQITEDIDRLECDVCGTEHIVNRSGGIVTLLPFIQSKKYAESRINRLKKVFIEKINDWWIGHVMSGRIFTRGSRH